MLWVGKLEDWDWKGSGHDANDFDADLDVDMEDFAYLQACYTELAQIVELPCRDPDLTGDGVVDQYDASVLLQCLSGQGIHADPTCAD